MPRPVSQSKKRRVIAARPLGQGGGFALGGMSRAQAEARSQKTGLRFVLTVLMAIFIVANLIQTSELLYSLSKESVRLVYALELAIILVFIGLDLIERRFAPPIFCGLALLYILVACATFSLHTGTTFNVNSALSYLIILSFGVFASRYIALREVGRTLFVAAVVYAVVYIIVSLWFADTFTHVDVEPVSKNIRVFGRDHYLDTRVVLSTPFIAYGIFYSGSRLREKFSPTHLACLAVFVVCVLLSNYRLFEIVLILMIPVVVFFRRLKSVAWLFPALFLAGAAVSLCGVANRSFNPYDYVAGDASGNARRIEYDAARDLIDRYPMLGLGIPASREDMNATVQSAHPLFYDDIGAMGILCGFGVLGLGLYLALGLATSTFNLRKAHAFEARDKALVCVGIFMSLYALTAPTTFGGPGTLFAALILATLYRRMGQRKA